MRRPAILLGLAILLGSSATTRADLSISIDSATVAAGSPNGPIVLNVYISNMTGVGGPTYALGDFSYEIDVSTDQSGQGTVLQFAPPGSQVTFGNPLGPFGDLSSNAGASSAYVFAGTGTDGQVISAGIDRTPNDDVGQAGASVGSPYANQFIGGDVDLSTDNNGNVLIAPGQSFLLTTIVLMQGVGDPNIPTPVDGSSFQVSLSTSGNTAFHTYDPSLDDPEVPIGYMSTSGMVTFGPAAAVPVPPAMILFGGGLAMTMIPGLRRRLR